MNLDFLARINVMKMKVSATLLVAVRVGFAVRAFTTGYAQVRSIAFLWVRWHRYVVEVWARWQRSARTPAHPGRQWTAALEWARLGLKVMNKL